ncbi:MAG TPA: sugar phosphate isomerase/epimerase family protein [bacterium]|nr:sugar phosphate isomerase/epimerase family protein [bacterium]
MNKYKIGSGFSPFTPCSERFVAEGYRKSLSLKEQIKLAGQVKGLKGIALDYPYQFSKNDIPSIKSLCGKQGQKICTVEAGIYPDRKWKQGSISSPDPGIRREAVALCMETLDTAAIAGAESVLLWPGQDGFDYPFQADYKKAWTFLIEGIREIAQHRTDIRIGIEYKPKEPRTNLFIRNAGILLHVLEKIKMDNVGGVVDFGHSLVAGENPAEAAVLLAREGKLFEVHLNDNYRDYDHDLIVGTVSFWETLEFFYWLDSCGYDGWYLMDVFPYREEGIKALQRSVNNTITFIEIARELRKSGMKKCLENRDVIASCSILWEKFFPG